MVVGMTRDHTQALLVHLTDSAGNFLPALKKSPQVSRPAAEPPDKPLLRLSGLGTSSLRPAHSWRLSRKDLP